MSIWVSAYEFSEIFNEEIASSQGKKDIKQKAMWKGSDNHSRPGNKPRRGFVATGCLVWARERSVIQSKFHFPFINLWLLLPTSWSRKWTYLYSSPLVSWQSPLRVPRNNSTNFLSFGCHNATARVSRKKMVRSLHWGWLPLSSDCGYNLRS